MNGRFLYRTAVNMLVVMTLGCTVAQTTAPPNQAAVRLTPDQLVAKIPVGSSPHRLAVGDGMVWVANSGTNTVSRIDPETNEVVDTIVVGQAPVSISVGEGAVWVGNNLGSSVSRIDPKTDQVTAM